MLGGKLGKILDVTPKFFCSWHMEIPDKKRRKIEKDIVECMSQLSVPVGHSVLETDFIQALSPDGYHRLAVYASAFSSTALACISAFRPASLGASVARPRGASPITVILEMSVANGTGKVLDVTQSANQATVSTMQKVQMIPAGKTVTKYMARKGMNTSVNNEDGMVYNSDLTRRSPQRYDLADMRVFPVSEGRNSDGRVSFALKWLVSEPLIKPGVMRRWIEEACASRRPKHGELIIGAFI